MGAERIGLAPEQCVFVDDLPFNLEPGAGARDGHGAPHRPERTVDELERSSASRCDETRGAGGWRCAGRGSGRPAAAARRCRSKDLRQDATAVCQVAARRTARDRRPPTAPAQSSAFLAAGIAALTPELRELRA